MLRLYIIILLLYSVSQLNAQIVPVFENGEAQVVPEFENSDNWLRHDLWVETEFDSDGDGKNDRMHVAVTRPAQTESEGLRLPVIYISSPYFAGTAKGGQEYFWNVRHNIGDVPSERAHPPEVVRRGQRPVISNNNIKTWIPRGYIVVHSSSPGTGLSDGSPTVGGKNESLAPKAVIDWLCGRAKGYSERTGSEEVKAYWSTGKVGMTGTSYNGTIALAAALTGVKGLEAIIPVAPNTSYYHYYRSNGLIRSPGGYLGEDVDVLFDYIQSGEESKREWARKNIRDKEMANGQDRITGDYNDFWAGRDYLNQIDNMTSALFMSHGFNDWNVMPEHSHRIYMAAKENGLPAQIYYHQAGHGGSPPLALMNKWFTRYLHGIENGIENDPRAWIVRENIARTDPTPYSDYPNPEASLVKLTLAPGAPGQGTLSNKTDMPTVTETVTDNFSFSGSTLAQAEITNHRLIYVTEALKKDLHISGLSRINIKVASSKPAANLSIWLVSLPWDNSLKARIYDNVITRGWADIQNHKSLTESSSLQPGKFYELSFDLQPDDQIILAGQKIALMIFSSDKEFTLWPDPGTELTVDLSATYLELPVVGGIAKYKQAFD